MNASQSQDYERAVQVHHDIEALYPEIERHRAWFRGRQLVGRNVPQPVGCRSVVDLDRVFCALAIKAATTKRAVLTLCEDGDGDSAYTLSRVVLENGVLMKWLLGGDGRDRLETYVLFSSVLHERTISLIVEHFTHHPELVEEVVSHSDPYHVAIARTVFGGHENTWAYFPSEKSGKLRHVQIAEMFQESSGGFAYAGPYAMASQFIHSGPQSLEGIVSHLLETRFFQLRVASSPRMAALALSDSNVAMLLALDALNDYIGLDLGGRVKEIADSWVDYARATFNHAVSSGPPSETDVCPGTSGTASTP